MRARLASLDWRVAATLVIWVAVLWLLSWAAVSLSGIQSGWVGDPNVERFTIETQPVWQYVWARWDGQWYMVIAYGGYDVTRASVAFFPLYPLLLAAAHTLTSLPYAGAGLLVSYVCLGFGLYYLYRLARLDLDRDDTARTIITLALYPTAFFLLAVYTESLVLFLLCASLYYARMGRWWLVVPFAYAAGLAKVTGLILASALLCEVLLGSENNPQEREGKGWRSLLNPRQWLSRITLPKAAAVAAAPLGVLTYSAYLTLEYGEPLRFASMQSMWRGEGTLLEKLWAQISYHWHYSFTAEDLPRLGDTLALVVMALLSMYLARRVRLSYALLTGLFAALVVVSGDLMSLNRFMVSLGPVFIGMASATRRTPRTWVAMLVAFAAVQAYYALRFFLWKWVD